VNKDMVEMSRRTCFFWGGKFHPWDSCPASECNLTL